MTTEVHKINIKTYETMGYYWNGYKVDVALEMIEFMEKDVGFAYSYGTDSIRLYRLYLKNGIKLFTDLSGFKKINKNAKKHELDIPAKQWRKW